MNRKEFIKLASGTAALAVAGCVTAEQERIFHRNAEHILGL